MSITANIGQLRETIAKSRRAAPLASAHTVLMGASKGQSEAAIREAIRAGITDFGENRVQEAESKWPGIKNTHPDIRLHLIGPLQSNKVKEALALFDVIQTLDRPKLAEAIAKDPLSHARQFHIQINTGEEPQKAGIIPKDADAFIEDCMKRLQIPVIGLMCVPPADQPPAPHFAMLRDIAIRHHLKELSMGMSGDFETAARMGSSCVRIGTALFGERD